MKHLLFLAFLAVSSASVIPRGERPEYCNHGKAWGGATSCHNMNPSWTYDSTVDGCVEIPRGGCLSAENIFISEARCMAVCAPHAVVAAKNKEVKFNILNFNEWMDQVLHAISSGMKSVGADPIDVEGFVLDQIPGLKLGVEKFSLHGLSNIARVGDWAFDVKGITKYGVHGGVGVHDVSAELTAVAEMAGLGGDLSIKTSLNKFEVTFSFYVDLAHCTVGLEKFTLGEDMHIDIEIPDGSVLGDKVDETIEEVTNTFINTFNETVEKATLLALGSVNVCTLVASLIG